MLRHLNLNWKTIWQHWINPQLSKGYGTIMKFFKRTTYPLLGQIDRKRTCSLISAMLFMLPMLSVSQESITQVSTPILKFQFENDIESQGRTLIGNQYEFVKGIDGQALSIRTSSGFNTLSLNGLVLDESQDFTAQFWMKTDSQKPMVLLSQKAFTNKGMTAQLGAGWTLYTSGGTFAWNIGSGTRRLNYERDNGDKMPMNDNKWHQITMTYDKALREIRLYYDGHNKAIYKVSFDFGSPEPIKVGTVKNKFDYENQILQEIKTGAIQLQELADEFNRLGAKSLENDELLSLVVGPKDLLDEKIKKIDPSKASLIKQLKEKDLKKVEELRTQLLSNPYTIHQIREFTEIKPLNKIYSLESGKVIINQEMAKVFTKQERLYAADFDMDNLTIWESALNAEQVLKSFQQYRKSRAFKQKKKLSELTIGVWNIWHGGIHFTEEEHGWDSRMRIVEILKQKNVDVILMQETYSSGDFIAAELGYYFATSSDWDYRQQGSNISVLSRYPIEELYVPEGAEFMNVAAKLVLSKTQQIHAMSNWYGMNSFPTVYDFHEDRFGQRNTIPILFGGDFNAVPHTDGGDSPASVKMLDNGFTDAYRSRHPDVAQFPAFTHNSGVRIDQLYYTGKGLYNKSTEVISTWPGGFPSDHFLILGKFKLDN